MNTNFDVGGPKLPSKSISIKKTAATLMEGEQLPELLFHYTNADGLFGILRSKALWATCFQFLNDHSEHVYGEQFVQDLLRKRRDECGKRLRKIWQREAAAWANLIPHYAASTCCDGDLISQWRGYSQLHDGYSIAFRRAALERCQVGGSKLNVIPMFYSLDKQRKLVEKVLGEILEIFSSVEPEQREKVLQDGVFTLKIAILHLKDPSFAGEREWRMIRFDERGTTEKFRIMGGQIVPYLDIPISPGDIDHVIQGPGRYRVASGAVVSRFASSCGFGGIAVKSSRVPLG